MRLFRFLLKVFALALSGLLLLALLAPFIAPDRFVYSSFLGIAFPVLWLLGLVVFILNLKSNARWSMILALPLAFSLLFAGRHYSFKDISLPASSNTLSLLSFNVQVGRVIFDYNENRSPSNLETFRDLVRRDVDILCLQEMNPKVSSWFAQEKLFPYSFQAALKGTFIASQYEIIDFGEIDFGTRRNSCIWADLKTPLGIVRVYNVHLQSSKITEDTERVINESKRYSSEMFQSLGSILYKYEKHAIIRADQARQVKDHASRVDHPIIITGDINETPMSYVYQVLSRNMNDAFRTGRGMGLTFPRDYPLLRIDYAFLSKNLKAHNFEVLRNISLSDHFPIVTTFGNNNTD